MASLYRKRWTLEQAFNELTTYLRWANWSTLGYPEGGVVCLLRGNLLLQPAGQVVPNMRGVHGEEKVEEVSSFYLTNEINSVYAGMMVAIPTAKWEFLQSLNSPRLAAQLLAWARHVDSTSLSQRAIAVPRNLHQTAALRRPVPTRRYKQTATTKICKPNQTTIIQPITHLERAGFLASTCQEVRDLARNVLAKNCQAGKSPTRDASRPRSSLTVSQPMCLTASA